MKNEDNDNELEKLLNEPSPFARDLLEDGEAYQVDGKWYLEKDGVVMLVRWWTADHVHMVPITDPDDLPKQL